MNRTAARVSLAGSTGVVPCMAHDRPRTRVCQGLPAPGAHSPVGGAPPASRHVGAEQRDIPHQRASMHSCDVANETAAEIPRRASAACFGRMVHACFGHGMPPRQRNSIRRACVYSKRTFGTTRVLRRDRRLRRREARTRASWGRLPYQTAPQPPDVMLRGCMKRCPALARAPVGTTRGTGGRTNNNKKAGP